MSELAVMSRMAGDTKVVWDKGFLGVVADKEWDAIKASRQLKVEWSDAKPPFPDAATLYDHIRNAPVRASPINSSMKSVEARLNSSPRFKAASAVVMPTGVAPSGGLAR